jgi:hypothetical protein
MQKLLYAEIEQAAWDIQKLRSLGVNEESMADAHPSSEQVADLLKGILYLKERYPSFWAKGNDNSMHPF